MGENHFAYPWFEKYHLTYLWYVSVNFRNPPQAQPLQKHLLTPKHNITRIKTPKTQKLFERETYGVLRGLECLEGEKTQVSQHRS